jgi:hypothetical protein
MINFFEENFSIGVSKSNCKHNKLAKTLDYVSFTAPFA